MRGCLEGFHIAAAWSMAQLQQRRNKYPRRYRAQKNPRRNNTRNHQPSPKNQINPSTVKQASNHEIARIRLHGHGGITLARQRPRRIRSRCKSCTLCNHPTRCPFVFPLTNITPEMRFRPTLPFGASRWNAILVQMRPRGTMHLQWLRRLHALQHQQWIRQLRIKASGCWGRAARTIERGTCCLGVEKGYVGLA